MQWRNSIKANFSYFLNTNRINNKATLRGREGERQREREALISNIRNSNGKAYNLQLKIKRYYEQFYANKWAHV